MLHQHPWILLVLGGASGQWLFSAFVCTMPPLPPGANYFWKWMYAFLHTAAANIDKVHVPNGKPDLEAEKKNFPDAK